MRLYHTEQQDISVLFNQNKLQVMHNFGHANESNSNALKNLFSGNLTKHMKSKAHMKKCLELGVSVTSVDETEAEEPGTV